jgi:predicted negative regulator of RcsB-dependent stress response
VSAHLSEEEQIDAFKRWWQDNGKTTVAAVVVAAVAYVSWSFWQSHQKDLAAAASKDYDALAKLLKPEDNKPLTAEQKTQAKTLATGLVENHKSTLYADLASLALAKLAVEENDLATASTALRRVAETSSDAPTQELARLRLAKVLAAEGKIDESLGLLGSAVSPPFEASYAEAKGDILLAENRLAEALAAYQVALTAVDKTDSQSSPMRRSLLQFKMDNAKQPGAKNPLAQEAAPANPHAGDNPSVPLPQQDTAPGAR